jgi:hypothetical protein
MSLLGCIEQLVLKIHNLTPDHFHLKYKLSDNKATLVSDFCWRLNIAFSFDESSDLCEVELPNDEAVDMSPNILYSIDWSYLQKHTNKRLIITHRIIYTLDNYAKVLNDIVRKYGLYDRVYWLTFNPYDLSKKDNKFKLLYIDSLTLVYCEAGVAHQREVLLQRVNPDHYSFEYTPSSDVVVDKYFISSSRITKAHRLLSTYLIHNNIDRDKGIITFHGIDDELLDQNEYLLSEKDTLTKHSINYDQVIDFKNFRGEIIDDVSRGFFVSYKDDFLKKVQTSLLTYVQESTSNNNEIFVTEKTWQNYLMGRPFIMNSCKGTINYLNRYYGFKSFDSIFDESYDLMDNFVDRIYYGVEELSKFCDLSFGDAQAKIHLIQPILDHNKRIFNSINHKERFLKIFNER